MIKCLDDICPTEPCEDFSRFSNGLSSCTHKVGNQTTNEITDICDELKTNQQFFCPANSYRSEKNDIQLQENKNGCVCDYGYEWNKKDTICVKDTCEEQHAVNFGKNVFNCNDGFVNLNGACCVCVWGYKIYNNQKCILKEEYDKIFKNRPDGTLIKLKGSLGIYQIENGEKRPIKSAEIFLGKGYKWGDVVEVSRAEMNIYPTGTAVSMTLNNQNSDIQIINEQQSINILSNGTLVRVNGTYGVYLIQNNKKRPIKSGEIFLGRGYSWEDVVDIEQAVLDVYPLGEDVIMSESITIENEVQIITINVPKLRVRSLPSLNGKIIASVSDGQEYSILDERDGWYKINYEGSKTGWVMKKYTIKSDRI